MATVEIHKPPSLPPYPEMILAAIAALNEPNGSNKTSISKYIESKYGDLSAVHTVLLAHHLNVMKNSGEIVLWKNNYMKADPNAPPKRGRGRPPKPKDQSAQGFTPARPRGRPPKDPNTPRNTVKPKEATAGSGKKRGRPRKMAQPAVGMTGAATDQTLVPTMTPTLAPTTTSTMPMTAGSGRPRGRPPKVRTATVTEVSVQN